MSNIKVNGIAIAVLGLSLFASSTVWGDDAVSSSTLNPTVLQNISTPFVTAYDYTADHLVIAYNDTSTFFVTAYDYTSGYLVKALTPSYNYLAQYHYYLSFQSGLGFGNYGQAQTLILDELKVGNIVYPIPTHFSVDSQSTGFVPWGVRFGLLFPIDDHWSYQLGFAYYSAPTYTVNGQMFLQNKAPADYNYQYQIGGDDFLAEGQLNYAIDYGISVFGRAGLGVGVVDLNNFSSTRLDNAVERDNFPDASQVSFGYAVSGGVAYDLSMVPHMSSVPLRVDVGYGIQSFSSSSTSFGEPSYQTGPSRLTVGAFTPTVLYFELEYRFGGL